MTNRKINLMLLSYDGGTYTFAILDQRMQRTGEFTYLTGDTMLDNIGSAAKTYVLALPTEQRASKRKRNTGVMPKGSGGVRCTFCQASAHADGEGSPITLKHLPACPEAAQPNRAYTGVRRYLVVAYWKEDGLTEELIVEGDSWGTVRRLVPQILERDYASGWSIISVSETG